MLLQMTVRALILWIDMLVRIQQPKVPITQLRS